MITGLLILGFGEFRYAITNAKPGTSGQAFDNGFLLGAIRLSLGQLRQLVGNYN